MTGDSDLLPDPTVGARVLAVHVLTYDRELLRDVILDAMRTWRRELKPEARYILFQTFDDRWEEPGHGEYCATAAGSLSERPPTAQCPPIQH